MVRGARIGRAPGALVGLGLALVLGAAGVGCSGEEAVPLDELDELPSTTSLVTTPHQLAPTEQMRELARQQCLDDPDLEQGEVNAVDPANPDQILSSAVVDCDTVR